MPLEPAVGTPFQEDGTYGPVAPDRTLGLWRWWPDSWRAGIGCDRAQGLDRFTATLAISIHWPFLSIGHLYPLSVSRQHWPFLSIGHFYPLAFSLGPFTWTFLSIGPYYADPLLLLGPLPVIGHTAICIVCCIVYPCPCGLGRWATIQCGQVARSLILLYGVGACGVPGQWI